MTTDLYGPYEYANPTAVRYHQILSAGARWRTPAVVPTDTMTIEGTLGDLPLSARPQPAAAVGTMSGTIGSDSIRFVVLAVIAAGIAAVLFGGK